MKVKTLAIEAAARLLLDGELWKRVKKLVSDIDGTTELTSHEKHYIVLVDLKNVFIHISNAVLNLAITLAVTWARSKQV